MGERADGRWAAFEVGLVVPRQNGKDEILAARELWGLFVGGERLIIHSAHKFDTAMEHMDRLFALIDQVPEFRKRLAPRQPNRSHGNEGIRLRTGQRIRFRARTKSGGGRGYTGNCVIFNEAMELPEEIVGAIMPVLSARSMESPGPQVLFAGSAVDQQTMTNGVVLARLRDAGIRGENDRLAYLEWSAAIQAWLESRGLRFDPKRAEVDQITPEFLADREMQALANPAGGLRISWEHIETERRSPSMSARQYAIERLGVADWPEISDEAGRVISREAWSAIGDLEDGHQPITTTATFGLDANPDNTWAAIGIAGGRTDGVAQFLIADHRRSTDWLVERCVYLQARHRKSLFVVDTKGPLAHLIDDLKRAGVKVLEANTEDYGTACGQFLDSVTNAHVRYPAPQPELDEALASARMATLGDRWKWARRNPTSPDISPLVAVTLALWGHMRKPPRARVINPYDFV